MLRLFLLALIRQKSYYLANMKNNTNTIKTQTKGVIMLLATALIWGTSFVSQSIGSNSVAAFTFMGLRTLIGALFLLPYILIQDRIKTSSMNWEQKKAFKEESKKTIKHGIIIGLFLCVASNLQQFAFYEPNMTAGKIAFITAMYMFFVPLLGFIFFRKKISFVTKVCIILGFTGLYFLCFEKTSVLISGSISGKGDFYALLCAIFFTLQILAIERWAPDSDGVKLSCIQFFTCGIISAILMFIFENPELAEIKAALPPILYSGIMSCGIAYTMQVVGQKYCEATIASLLMCMESVFAAISGAIYIHESLSGREITGCAIMFAAIIISQIAGKISKN